MSTIQVSTTSVRIPIAQKAKLQKIAKARGAKFTKLLQQALDEYLAKQEILEKTLKFDEIIQEISKSETWTLEEEIEAVNKNRAINTRRFNLK